jgi:hypothetical protein
VTASENKEIVRKLRRAAEGNLPAWAVLGIDMDEIADLLLLVDTITDLRKNEETRARVLRERKKACDELITTLDRIADNEKTVAFIPPEYQLEIANKRGRAAAFARAAEIARDMLGGEPR